MVRLKRANQKRKEYNEKLPKAAAWQFEKKKKRSYDALFEHFGEKKDVKMDVKNPE